MIPPLRILAITNILFTHLNILNHRRFEMGHFLSPISNFEVDLSEDVTGPVPLQIFKGINGTNPFSVDSLRTTAGG